VTAQGDPAVLRPLEGRRALVTGGSSGIGAATAARLAGDGAAVVVGYVGRADAADELVATIAAAGGTAIAHRADVTDEEDVQGLFAAAHDHLGGPVDLLVNNAGVESPHRLVEMPLAEWRHVLEVNLTGPFLCARAAARGLISAGRPGVIVNVTSVHEVVPWEAYSHYCAAKAGLKLFGQTIAKELAPHAIRVVSIAPGAIATPINAGVLADSGRRSAVEAEIPWGRFGRPEEVAAAIAWVAGPSAEYVTGSTLFVDGGMCAYPNFT
jgi:glucose 1-dehydrogenase